MDEKLIGFDFHEKQMADRKDFYERIMKEKDEFQKEVREHEKSIIKSRIIGYFLYQKNITDQQKEDILSLIF